MLTGGPRIISQQSGGVRRCRPQPSLGASVCSWLIWEWENQPGAKHHRPPRSAETEGVISNQGRGGTVLSIRNITFNIPDLKSHTRMHMHMHMHTHTHTQTHTHKLTHTPTPFTNNDWTVEWTHADACCNLQFLFFKCFVSICVAPR